MGISGSNERKDLSNKGFEKAIASISNKGTKGIGFLCKLPFPDAKNTLPVLITSTDLIGRNEIENKKQVLFIVENTPYAINIDNNRKTYINEDLYKISIIEIIDDDNLNINSFFEFDEEENLKLEKLKKTEKIGVVINNEKERRLEYLITKIKKIKENGIDITQKPIPVAPAAHYTMGGIKAGVDGTTSIKGLYAIGETASTGLHGANRLASNSLLECVVCAYELADYLSFANLETPKRIDSGIKKMIDVYSRSIKGKEYDYNILKSQLKDIMWNYVGIIRTEENLKKAKKEVEKLQKDFKRQRKCLNQGEYEYRNMLTVASLIIKGALERKESRGAHCRSDYSLTLKEAYHSNIDKLDKKGLSYVK